MSNANIETNYQPKSGTTNGNPQGTMIGAATIDLNGNKSPDVGTLAAKVVVTAVTSSMTLAIRWQVSSDNSAWIDVLLPGSDVVAALTDLVIATGDGVGVSKTVVASAPRSVYGSRYSRIALIIGGADSANAGDVYSVSYAFKNRAQDFEFAS